MQIVDAVELICKNLVALKKVAQISAGIIAAGIAVASLVHRPLIFPIAAIFYNNSAA